MRLFIEIILFTEMECNGFVIPTAGIDSFGIDPC